LRFRHPGRRLSETCWLGRRGGRLSLTLALPIGVVLGRGHGAEATRTLSTYWHSTRSRWPLSKRVEILDQERRELGPDYQDHGVLFCWEDGRPPHPDTITRRFKSSPRRLGCQTSTCTTCGTATSLRDAKIDWKALSKRIGHADVTFTMKQYVQTDLEADRHVATTLAELIIGGSLVSMETGSGSGVG
jgi:hypothetical protein